MVKLSPSLLAADFLHIEDEVKRMADAGADWLHFDVMDGRFVPNISFGQVILKAAASTGYLPCDVHLMIEEPEKYVEEFAEAGARVITVHAEATRHLQRLLQRIRDLGCLAGVSLNPATPPDCLKYVMGDFDLALVMTVNPGFGGQKLLQNAAGKISVIRDMLAESGVSAEIEVDGGINERNARGLIEKGATVIVAGTSLFGSPDPAAFIRTVKNY